MFASTPADLREFLSFCISQKAREHQCPHSCTGKSLPDQVAGAGHGNTGMSAAHQLAPPPARPLHQGDLSLSLDTKQS